MSMRWVPFLFVFILSICLAGFASRSVAQTISEERVVGNWKASTGGRNLEVQLSSRGSAVTKVDRQTYSGSWRIDGANRIIVDTGRGGSGFAFTFRLVDGELVATSWDKDTFGSRQLRLRRDGRDPNPDPLPDMHLEGDYYWERPGAGGAQVITLSLESRGRATLTVESGARGSRPTTSRGSWDVGRDDKIDVDVNGSRGRDRFTFRRSGNRLIATSWDRGDWGRDTPTFSKGRKPEILPIEEAEGIWLYDYDGVKYTLTLHSRRADWLEEDRRGNRVQADGTWNWEGDEIRVRINRRRDTLNFRFKIDRDRLTASNWDRDEFGSRRPEFRRR
ncbi:MAG: hypothetical protein K1X67_18770 [Fimbriimonadaceae bacterium]|nr:hypothetical protein [Fimbriimonadaceae bacterium]